MSDQDALESILASLYDAMLDDSRWPAASALIDDACGLKGNGLMVAEGPENDIRATCVGAYYRGQRRHDPDLVARMLELTPAESEVAVSLAEGRSVRDIAEATGSTRAAISHQVKGICRRHSISRQADLARLVRSLADFR